jgi:hypothetical protein
VRLVEIRLLEGPNVYRLAPVVKIEVASAGGGPGTASASRGGTRSCGLGASIPRREWPGQVERMVLWVRRLRHDHGEGRGGEAVHRSSDPGHWIVTFPWSGAERAHSIARPRSH